MRRSNQLLQPTPSRSVEIDKGYERNRPQTVCRITAEGRARYLEYLETLEQVVKDAAKGAKEAAVRGLTPSRV